MWEKREWVWEKCAFCGEKVINAGKKNIARPPPVPAARVQSGSHCWPRSSSQPMDPTIWNLGSKLVPYDSTYYITLSFTVYDIIYDKSSL